MMQRLQKWRTILCRFFFRKKESKTFVLGDDYEFGALKGGDIDG